MPRVHPKRVRRWIVLPLPMIDTVERIQGARRDIVIFGITSSDPDHMLGSFLNNPNRLNVSMTKAKKKLIIIGSRAFFLAIPDSEPMLEKNRCLQHVVFGRGKKTVLVFDILIYNLV